ncbi:site-specific integrase [Nonomuraea muscovyensis]|uniref:site-specific integrase n=1 Tax=Nonomuraea muscovyensis TaxID=1124761 RepID=UPI0034089352
MTGRVVECPIDEMNRPRGHQPAKIRIPPTADQVTRMFSGWREELSTCRKFGPAARNYTACRLMADVGLRVNEACKLDLADVKWDLGRFGKLHVRHGKVARGSGPRERMVPLINNAGGLRWFVEDVWGQFGDDHTRPGVPLLLSERKNADGTVARVGDETIRAALAKAATAHLPDWPDDITPHVLRHFCASQLYLAGMDLLAIQKSSATPGSPRPCIRSRPLDTRRGRLARRSGACGHPIGRTTAMRWNLRPAAANRGIWKASELQRMLAEHGLKMSAGKRPGLWSGEPASIKLERPQRHLRRPRLRSRRTPHRRTRQGQARRRASSFRTGGAVSPLLVSSERLAHSFGERTEPQD